MNRSVCLLLLCSFVAHGLAPSRATGSVVADWRFTEHSGTVTADNGQSPPLPLNLNGGASTVAWRSDTYGLNLDLRTIPNSAGGLVGTDVNGIEKVFMSTEQDYGWNYTMEAWVNPSTFPSADTYRTIFQLCDSNQDFLQQSLPPPCMKMGQYTEVGQTMPTFTYSWQLIWETVGPSALMLQSFGFTQRMPATPGLHHVVARYRVTRQATYGTLASGSGLSQIFVDGYDFSNTNIGVRQTQGNPVNSWGTQGSTHTWRTGHPTTTERRMTVGFNYNNTGIVQSGNGFQGSLHQITLYNRSLSDVEILANAQYGPPSTPPVAGTGGSATTMEDVPVSFTLPVTDIDQVIGWDWNLTAVVVSIAASAPVGCNNVAGVLTDVGGVTIGTGAYGNNMTSAGPRVTFVPSTGWWGTATITFRGMDWRSVQSTSTSTFTVTVTNVNHNGVATGFTNSTYAGIPITVALMGTTTDSEADLPAKITALPPAQYGTLTTPAGGAVFENVLLATPSPPPACPPALSWVTFTPTLNIVQLSRQPFVLAPISYQVWSTVMGTASNTATGTVVVKNNAIAFPQVLNVTENSRSEITLTGVDMVPGFSCTYRIVSVPYPGKVYQWYPLFATDTPSTDPMSDGDAVTDSMGRVIFIPQDYFFGATDTFTFSCISAHTKIDSVPAPVSINVTFVPFPPVVSALNFEVFEFEANLTFALTAWSPSFQAMRYQVTTLPTIGTLYQYQDYTTFGPAFTVPATVSDPGNLLSFKPPTPATYGSQGYYAVFSFTATDTSGRVGTPNTCTILVKNDLYVGNITRTMLAGINSTTFNLIVAHPVGAAVTVTITKLPDGTLSVGGVPVTAVPLTVGPPYLMSYTPANSRFGLDTFTYQIKDSATTETVMAWGLINVLPIPGPPVIYLPVLPLRIKDKAVLTIHGLKVLATNLNTVFLNITANGGCLIGLNNPPTDSTFTSSFKPLSADSPFMLDPFYFSSSQTSTLDKDSVFVVYIEATSGVSTVKANFPITVYANPEELSTDTTVVAAVASAAGAALLFGAAVAYILIRARTRTPVLPPPPDFAPIIFADAPIAKQENMPPQAQMLSFEQLLTEPKFGLCLALFEITKASQADHLARDIVYIFEASNTTVALMKFAISREVQIAENAKTLFRSNSMSTKMLKVYAKMHGCEYLYYTLGHHLMLLQAENSNYEIDPSKIRLDEEADADINKWRLLSVSQQLFKSIMLSLNDLPYEFRDICAHLMMEVSKRFPQKKFTAVGGFFFLRFICPAITAPESFGLVRDVPNSDMRRLLVLAAKTLQNLATGTEFKESHMENMNVFIRENRDKIIKFYEDISTLPSDKGPSPRGYDIPPRVREGALFNVFMHTKACQDDLNHMLENARMPAATELQEKLAKVMREDPPPPTPAPAAAAKARSPR